MHIKEKHGIFFNAKNKLFELPGIIIALGFLLPFFILAFFDCPTLDDYSFAIKVREFGYWGGQVSAYTDWNGRYFASAILLAHPLAIPSYTLYKIIPVILLALTIHSVYYFISNCFSNINKKVTLIFSLLVAFFFLNQMPTLVQGIYWEPGAITYHLANIMTLYLCTLIIISFNSPEKFSRFKKVSGGILVLAIVGSNETSMLTIGLLILSLIFYYLLAERKINKLLLVYLLLAVIGTVVVLIAPGNAIREMDCMNVNKHHVWFTVKNCFIDGSKYIYEWLFKWQTAALSVFAIFFSFIWGKPIQNKKTGLILVLVVVLGYFLLCSTFASGLWSIANVAPDRAVNVTYWLFVLIWISFLYLTAQFIVLRFPSLKNLNFKPWFFIAFVLVFATIETSGNFLTACTDLTGKKAFIYQKEYLERVKIMNQAPLHVVIKVPSYSMFPHSLLITDDVTKDSMNWTNLQYREFFNKDAVKLLDRKLYYSHNYLMNYDAPDSRKMKNGNQITNQKYFSPPNSTFALPGPDSYSAAFQLELKNTDFSDTTTMMNLNVGAEIYSDDSLIDAAIVITVVGSKNHTDNVISWSALDLSKNNCPANKWNKKGIVIPVKTKMISDPENKLVIYLWNKGKGNIYMDDLLVRIY